MHIKTSVPPTITNKCLNYKFTAIKRGFAPRCYNISVICPLYICVDKPFFTPTHDGKRIGGKQ